ncbi:PTS family enzyme IIA, mannitol-specific, cryptic [Salmonella enterica subsp. enterica serovar Pullorum]|nr:PTS family enzyme IIA, mannitol-specific, cryptic [Salmonella enterica subsp. enterica serovar Pullorum]
MLGTWLSDATITLRESVETWSQALEICGKPLLDAGVIAPEYITAIVQQHQKLGPYYVLAPGLAMPHARPEEGGERVRFIVTETTARRFIWRRRIRSG